MVWLAVALLPQTSVAIQVRVTFEALGQLPGVVTSEYASTAGPQASVAVGLLNDGVPGHSIVASPPTPVITGGWVSTTWNVAEAVALLPHASVAVQVRVTSFSLAQRPGVVASLKVIVA